MEGPNREPDLTAGSRLAKGDVAEEVASLIIVTPTALGSGTPAFKNTESPLSLKQRLAGAQFRGRR